MRQVLLWSAISYYSPHISTSALELRQCRGNASYQIHHGYIKIIPTTCIYNTTYSWKVKSQWKPNLTETSKSWITNDASMNTLVSTRWACRNELVPSSGASFGCIVSINQEHGRNDKKRWGLGVHLCIPSVPMKRTCNTRVCLSSK